MALPGRRRRRNIGRPSPTISLGFAVRDLDRQTIDRLDIPAGSMACS